MSVPMIVAEVTVNWLNGDLVDAKLGPLAHRFEHVIATNRKRGYVLRDWRFSQVVYSDTTTCEGRMVETIIAVFELTRKRAPSRRDGGT